jgi:hypothetical protein
MSTELGFGTEVLNALTEEQKKPKMVCSVYPESVAIMHSTTGTYEFEACPKGDGEYRSAMVHVAPGMRKDLAGLGHIVIFDTSAEDFAWDVIGVSKAMRKDQGGKAPSTGSDWFKRGFFVPAGDAPTERELKSARERLHKWCLIQVQQGDQEFSARQQISDVSSAAKTASTYLGLQRDWASGNTQTSDQKIRCPECLEEINFGAGKCRFCGSFVLYKDGRAVKAGK